MTEPDGGVNVDAGNNPPQPGWWQASDGNWYSPEQHPGQIPPPPPAYAAAGHSPAGYGAAPSTGMATAALVLGILSILFFWAFGFGVVLGVLAVIFGVIGTKKANTQPGRPAGGRATAGIVTGAIGTVVGGVFLVIAMISFLGSSAEEQFREVGTELDSSFDEGINTDPANGWCDEDRYMQDPDC